MILNIQPLNIEGYSFEQNRQIEDRLENILQGWDGTPYCPGQQCKGVAVDCVRFVSGVLDEMFNLTNVLERLPQDASFHNPDLVKNGLRSFLKKYPCGPLDASSPNEIEVQPLDVVIMGPKNGGPGHAGIVGVHGFWHCNPYGVAQAGLEIEYGGVYNYKGVRRGVDRELWYDIMIGESNGK